MASKNRGGLQAQANLLKPAPRRRPPARPLDEVVEESNWLVQDLRGRHAALLHVTDEIERCSRGKPTRWWSTTLLTFLRDTWVRGLFDVSSWAKGATSPGGFVDELQAHRRAFTRVARRLEGNAAPFQGSVDRAWARHFRFLFPLCRGDVPSLADFAFLKERIHRRCYLVRRERNRLAHVHDRPGELTKGPPLDMRQLTVRLEFLMRLLRTLSIVGLDKTVHFNLTDDAPGVVADLADQLILGPGFMFGRAAPKWYVRREEIYTAMHAAHDMLTTPSQKTFNEDAGEFVYAWLKASGEEEALALAFPQFR